MDRPRRELPKKGSLEDRWCPKQAASPAQEATKARIASLESQLRKLKAAGTLDQKANYQIRCLEEDLRKAHSKLRRLLNEAERQRRRRERLRGGITTVPYEPPKEDAVMSTLKSCTRFEDLVQELNILGFTITQNDDFTDEGESMPEVDGVKVEVELIEGDGEVETEPETIMTMENGSSTSSSEVQCLKTGAEDEDNFEQKNKESYRRWFERQTEMQQRWEENFMREQMELARSLLESVTATFLQGVQQVLNSLTTERRFPPFSPDLPPS